MLDGTRLCAKSSFREFATLLVLDKSVPHNVVDVLDRNVSHQVARLKRNSSMKTKGPKPISRLEDLPNIGSHIANDLRAIGIASPVDLRRRVPLTVFNDLKETMGRRHDPCVYYTLLSVEHFFTTSEKLPWWRFTTTGKTHLNKQRAKKNP